MELSESEIYEGNGNFTFTDDNNISNEDNGLD